MGSFSPVGSFRPQVCAALLGIFLASTLGCAQVLGSEERDILLEHLGSVRKVEAELDAIEKNIEMFEDRFEDVRDEAREIEARLATPDIDALAHTLSDLTLERLPKQPEQGWRVELQGEGLNLLRSSLGTLIGSSSRAHMVSMSADRSSWSLVFEFPDIEASPPVERLNAVEQALAPAQQPRFRGNRLILEEIGAAQANISSLKERLGEVVHIEDEVRRAHSLRRFESALRNLHGRTRSLEETLDVLAGLDSSLLQRVAVDEPSVGLDIELRDEAAKEKLLRALPPGLLPRLVSQGENHVRLELPPTR